MHICIDSCVFIRGLQHYDPVILRIFGLISPELVLKIPRLVAREVTRNLSTPEQKDRFYRIFRDHTTAIIIDEEVPRQIIDKYIRLGLPSKGDAIIGAFAEWQQVSYLLSDNRHFLQTLQTDAFCVMDVETFIARF